MTENGNKRGFSPLLAAVGTVAGAVIGWIVYSSRSIDHNLPLSAAIDAEKQHFLGARTTRFMNYYADNTAAEGRPLVLIHSINAAASAYEMKPIFQHYRGLRPVYALELPGFGFSERSDRTYSVQLFKDAILDFLADVVGQPADVVALSLSCELMAHAALEAPAHFHSLVMISPSGFTSRENKGRSQSAAGDASDRLYALFSNPVWSQAFYDLVATRRSIRYFLQQSFEGPVDESLIHYSYATAHQPGARYAPLYFVSGKLFSPRIREEVYEKLTLPVLVLYDRDAFVRFDTLPNLAIQHENWEARRIAPTKGLPQFEQLARTTAEMDAFWGSRRDMHS